MNAIVEKIPSSNSTKGNVLNNKNVSNNSKMLNESKKKSINTFILKINQSFNQSIYFLKLFIYGIKLIKC